jgi:hypothetical protein
MLFELDPRYIRPSTGVLNKQPVLKPPACLGWTDAGL